MKRRRILMSISGIALGLTLGFVTANLRAARADEQASAMDSYAPVALANDEGARAIASSFDQMRRAGFSHDLIAFDDFAGEQGAQQSSPPSRPAQQAGQTTSPPRPDAPVEQVRRNIQVLRGLPNSQLFPLMNLIGVSIGATSCAACHVRNGEQWDWASDERESKRVARQMMRMTMDINRTNNAILGGNYVTCYTCHRGHREPESMPALPLVRSAHEPAPSPSPGASPGAAQTPSQRPPRPTVEQILNRYVEAVGGQAAVARLGARVLTGTREASQGRNWQMEIVTKSPDKFLITLTTPQGIVQQGFNGTTGWISNPNEHRAATADELVQLRRAAEIYNVLQVSAPLPGMRLAGRERIGEQTAWVLEAPLANGASGVEQFFFDAQTGLLLRRLVLMNTVLFPIPEQIDFEDYRDAGGVRVPYTIRVSDVDTFSSSTRRFTEIRPNASVDDARFNLPPARR